MQEPEVAMPWVFIAFLEKIIPRTAGAPGHLPVVEVKARIRRGQYQALRAVNAELVQLYWDIGEAIHRKQENFGWGRSVVETLSPTLRAQAILAVKDHYTFDFLDLAEAHSERELERGLVNNLRHFLAEMGGACAFVGNQHRIAVGGQEYFIDLVLFHRRLRCLIAIDLKIGAFQPEHKGKMEFYLEALDAQERMDGENPPIGIIICRDKNMTVVEYALRTAGRPIGVATYAIVPQLPEAYRDQLPSPEAIAERLRLWEQAGAKDGE